jgi:hypothetical protein
MGATRPPFGRLLIGPTFHPPGEAAVTTGLLSRSKENASGEPLPAVLMSIGSYIGFLALGCVQILDGEAKVFGWVSGDEQALPK